MLLLGPKSYEVSAPALGLLSSWLGPQSPASKAAAAPVAPLAGSLRTPLAPRPRAGDPERTPV
jgi:hypothetical protein